MPPLELDTADGQRRSPAKFQESLKAAALLTLIIFLAALSGIMTRPLGFLSPFWPANALLVGLMVRNRTMASASGWLGAFSALVAADLVTGNDLAATLVLTGANLLGAAVAYICLAHLPARHVQLQSTRSVMYLILLSLAASFCSAIGSALVQHQLFGEDFIRQFNLWFMGELLNYVVVLPVVLAGSPPAQWLATWRNCCRSSHLAQHFDRVVPFLALLLSGLAASSLDGPGAVIYSVPALLWCALSYSLFGMTLVTLLFSSWTMIAISAHHIDLMVAWPLGEAEMLSIRIGVMLMTLTPLTVVIVSTARQKLLRQVQYLASHDQLSGLLNRRAFDQQASEMLRALNEQHHPVAALMLDIDHFKRINDTWGHAAGDQVLITFARLASECLQNKGVLGRMGGEEFAVLMPASSQEQAREVAETIRRRFAETPVDWDSQTRIQATVSIGVVIAAGAAQLHPLLTHADRMLYQAKHNGRNRVHLECLD